MKITMTVSMAGTEFALSVGEVTERFDNAEAHRLIEAGYAVPFAEAAADVAKRDAKARRAKPETR
jgi:hypothetical protein